jgi:hypothetical protein
VVCFLAILAVFLFGVALPLVMLGSLFALIGTLVEAFIIKMQNARTGEQRPIQGYVNVAIISYFVFLPLAFLYAGALLTPNSLVYAVSLPFVIPIGSLFALIGSLVAAFIIKRQNARTGGQRPIQGYIAVAVTSGIVFLPLTFCYAQVSQFPNYVESISRRTEKPPPVCRELLIARDYKIKIFQYSDGHLDGHLQRADGSRSFSNGITHCAKEGNILIMARDYDTWVGPSTLCPDEPGPDFVGWLLFNMSTEQFESYRDKTEYLTALRKLGIKEEPTLWPVKFYCQRGSCRPCD